MRRRKTYAAGEGDDGRHESVWIKWILRIKRCFLPTAGTSHHQQRFSSLARAMKCGCNVLGREFHRSAWIYDQTLAVLGRKVRSRRESPESQREKLSNINCSETINNWMKLIQMNHSLDAAVVVALRCWQIEWKLFFIFSSLKTTTSWGTSLELACISLSIDPITDRGASAERTEKRRRRDRERVWFARASFRRLSLASWREATEDRREGNCVSVGKISLLLISLFTPT